MLDKQGEGLGRPGTRLLALDGGTPGKTELSELILLQKLMCMIEWDKELSETPHPHGYFDLIGGSGMGGVFALLLGRLKMSIDEAVEAYRLLYTKVFSTTAWMAKDTNAATDLLREAFREILGSTGTDLNELLQLKKSESCKVFVSALNPVNLSSPRLLRTYRSRSGQSPKCSILEALLACLADQEHISAVVLGTPPLTEKFVAAGRRFNNPTYHVIQEAKEAFRENPGVACIVSIGIGHPGHLSLPSTGPIDHDTLVKICEDSEQQAGVFGQLFSGPDEVFYRLNVTQGLQLLQNCEGSSDMLGDVVTHTTLYCELNDTAKHFDRLVKALLERPAVMSSEQITSICGPNVKDQLFGAVQEVKSDVKDIRASQLTAEENALLERLRPEGSKREHTYQPCMEGTRVDILEEIHDWVDTPDAPNVFWLHGHPGTGKSTIAVSVRDQLRKSGKLGASFFFQRSEATFQTPAALWQSIAYQLARKSILLRKHIVDGLKTGDIDLDSSSHSELFQTLIRMPMSTLERDTERTNELFVVVIDALDECGGLEEQVNYQRKVLEGLRTWPTFSTQFRIFITSRDYGNIESILGAPSNKFRVLEVGERASEQSFADIKLYLRTSFEDITGQYQTIQRSWPADADLELLANAAAGLFIWASTVINLVSHGRPSVFDKILRKVKDGDISGNLDGLYNAILDMALKDPDDQQLAREISGAIVAAKTPLTAAAIASLLQLDGRDVEFVCKSLQPVLSFSSTLHFLHQSFVDFLIRESCIDSFRIDLLEQEQQLAVACFTTMKRDLCFNIGCIETSHVLNCEIPGLAERISDHLSYSCRFWSEHLQQCPRSLPLEDLTLAFLEDQLLLWLEVLSISAFFGTATKSLSTLVKWAQNCKNTIVLMARDALSFVRTFAIPISQSSPHIYLSALAFAPLNSTVRKRYIPQYSRLLRLKTGYHLGWPSLQGSLQGHKGLIRTVAFTPDGQRIVSCSVDCTIRVWDLNTQLQIGEPLQDHGDTGLSFAFFPDGQRIVSCSKDGTLRIWDLETQKQIWEPLRGHDGPVVSVDVSRDGKRILSGSEDCTIRIWDSETRQQIGEPIQVCGESVESIAYFPHGKRIISITLGGTVRVWDAVTHEQVGDPIQGPTGDSFAFSSDGTRIAIMILKGGFGLYDAITLQQLGSPSGFDDSFALSLAFSPDGRRIATGSDDSAIRIWNADTLEPIGEPLRGHSDAVISVSFSLDGQRVVSGSIDCTIRIWELSVLQSQSSPEDIQEHVQTVHSVAFSPDGRRIVSGSEDCTIRFWNSDTMQQIGRTLRLPQGKLIFSVAFSPDGKRIVSCSHNDSMRLWDAESQVLLQEAGEEDKSGNAAFSPDGRKILSSSFRNACIWDACTLEKLGQILLSDRVLSVGFAPDGESVGLALSNGGICLAKLDNMEQHRESQQRLTEPNLLIAFSPDGRKVISGSRDGTIHIWDAKTLKHIGDPLKGHTDTIRSIDVSSGRNWILSGSQDGTIRLWDINTHKQIGQPLEHCGCWINSVSFSPDGRRFISGANDSTVRIWDVETYLADHLNDKSISLCKSPDRDSLGRLIFLEDGRLSPILATILTDGWVLGTNNERSFWVPHDLIPSLPWPYLLGIGGRQMVTFDPSDFHHGLKWTECKASP